MSVVFVVVPCAGCGSAATPGFLAAKAPPDAIDSPASESEMMVPVPSLTGLRLASGSVVTYMVRFVAVSQLRGPLYMCILQAFF